MKNVKSITGQLIRAIRRTLWSLIVAYMLGLHNFYYGDDKTKDDIRITVEVKEEQSSSTPKD